MLKSRSLVKRVKIEILLLNILKKLNILNLHHLVSMQHTFKMYNFIGVIVDVWKFLCKTKMSDREVKVCFNKLVVL